MNDVILLHQVLTRCLLIGSFVVFAIGASVPALNNFWGMTTKEGLLWIAANPGKWSFSSISFIFSLMMAVAGLVLFNQTRHSDGAQLFTCIGFFLFFTGAIFWILNMGFRLSIAPWAAKILVETSVLPDSFIPLRLLETKLYDIFMVSTFLASSIYGLALLNSTQFTKGVGWFSIVYGLVAAFSFVAWRAPIPIMTLVVPLLLGTIPYPVLGAQG